MALLEFLGRRKCRRNLLPHRLLFVRWFTEGPHVWKLTRAERLQGTWRVVGICQKCCLSRRVYLRDGELSAGDLVELRALA